MFHGKTIVVKIVKFKRHLWKVRHIVFTAIRRDSFDLIGK